MNKVAGYGGFPTRYPHWSFGMEYEQLKKSYAYGLHKIYEMVINNDPSYAYLLENNALVDQKIVMAHVYGHTDFFKNNHWFSATNRKMMDGMANHGTVIRRYAEKFGYEEVENFVDTGISIDDLIDFHSLFIKRHSPSRVIQPDEEDEGEESYHEHQAPFQRLYGWFRKPSGVCGRANKKAQRKKGRARTNFRSVRRKIFCFF